MASADVGGGAFVDGVFVDGVFVDGVCVVAGGVVDVDGVVAHALAHTANSAARKRDR